MNTISKIIVVGVILFLASLSASPAANITLRVSFDPLLPLLLVVSGLYLYLHINKLIEKDGQLLRR